MPPFRDIWPFYVALLVWAAFFGSLHYAENASEFDRYQRLKAKYENR